MFLNRKRNVFAASLPKPVSSRSFRVTGNVNEAARILPNDNERIAFVVQNLNGAPVFLRNDYQDSGVASGILVPNFDSTVITIQDYSGAVSLEWFAVQLGFAAVDVMVTEIFSIPKGD